MSQIFSVSSDRTHATTQLSAGVYIARVKKDLGGGEYEVTEWSDPVTIVSPVSVNGLSGNISLVAGDNINISQSGQNVSIAADGGLSLVESPTLSIDSSLDDNGNLTLDVAWPTAPFGVFATNRSPGEVLVRWQEPIPRRLRYYVEYEVAQPPNAPTISNLSVTADGLIGDITSDDDADFVEIQHSADGTTFV